MEEPRLYEWYDRKVIMHLLGDPRHVVSYCDGQWLVAQRVTVCLTKIAKTPPGFDWYRGGTLQMRFSHFGDAATFIWAADKPYEIRDQQEYRKWFLPAQVDAEQPPKEENRDEVQKRFIYLFVRTDGAEHFMYVGRLEASYGGGNPLNFVDGRVERAPSANFGTALFRMAKRLPDEIRLSLFGPDPGDMDHASLDRALSRLSGPTTVTDRLEILRRLVDYWHSPIQSGDGYSDDELAGKPMPDVLRWWYRWGGRRKSIMSGDNELLDPEKLEYTGDGMLVFFKESQHCNELATYPEGDDPPVFSREGTAGAWEPENNTLSEHLMLACLDAAVPSFTPHRATSIEDLADDVVHQLEKRIPPLSLRPWRWWGGMRFYAKNGAFMKVGDDNTVWIGAKTAMSLRPIKRFLNEDEWTRD